MAGFYVFYYFYQFFESYLCCSLKSSRFLLISAISVLMVLALVSIFVILRLEVSVFMSNDFRISSVVCWLVILIMVLIYSHYLLWPKIEILMKVLLINPQWWRVTVFRLTNHFWWLQLWPGSFNLSLAWFLNLFGVKVLILSLPKVLQATLSGIFTKSACVGECQF